MYMKSNSVPKIGGYPQIPLVQGTVQCRKQLLMPQQQLSRPRAPACSGNEP